MKICPFCGGNAELTYGEWDYNIFGVSCSKCKAYVPSFAGKEDAVEKWNQRVVSMEEASARVSSDCK